MERCLKLTKEIAYKAITDFFSAEKPFVLFGTGTSCALDMAFGMPALEKFLRQEFSDGLNDSQIEQWQLVLNALDTSTHDFESAMDFIQDVEFTNRIVEATANFVAHHDGIYSYQIMSGEKEWPACGLLSKLVDTLPPNDRQLHVATPNYDLLAEYSFISKEISYITGFYGGYYRKYDWSQARKVVQSVSTNQGKTKRYPKIIEQNHIRLHKPHGSLNTFEINSQLIECDGWITKKPDNVVRSMITPGTAKYKRLHNDRAQLAEYDRAVSAHNSFLFLGFGFNDSQLVNNTFRQKLEKGRCPALVITRDSNPRIEEWLVNCPNMWIICKHENNDQTRIFNSKFDDWLYLEDKELWRFNYFTSEFLGG